MNRIFAVAVAICLAGSAWAQDPAELFRKAPPEVDSALRARITSFMQAHVDGKFRLAETLVAEDTKDFFYANNKPRYLSFEIKSIDYTDNFTRAKATIIGETVIPVPQFAGRPMKIPFASYWKIEKDDWYWYVDQALLRQTPFGEMKPGPDRPGAGSPGTLPAIPSQDEALKALWSQVKVEPQTLELAPGASERVSIANGMPGGIKLTLEGVSSPALSVSIQPADLAAGAKAVLTVSAGSEWSSGDGAVSVRVSPSNQLLVVRVRPPAKK